MYHAVLRGFYFNDGADWNEYHCILILNWFSLIFFCNSEDIVMHIINRDIHHNAMDLWIEYVTAKLNYRYSWQYCGTKHRAPVVSVSIHRCLIVTSITTQIAKFMEPTWGPPGSCRTQMGPMLAPWIYFQGMHAAGNWKNNTVVVSIHLSKRQLYMRLWNIARFHTAPQPQTFRLYSLYSYSAIRN